MANAETPDPSKEPSLPEYQKQFIDSLECFMEQCYVFVENQKEAISARFNMTEEERIAKIKEVTNMIQEKEKELCQLEAERAALNALGQESQKVQASANQGAGANQGSSSTNFHCFESCSADCSSSRINTSNPNQLQVPSQYRHLRQ